MTATSEASSPTFSSKFFLTYDVGRIGNRNFQRDFLSLLDLSTEIGPGFFQEVKGAMLDNTPGSLLSVTDNLVGKTNIESISIRNALAIARFLIRAFSRHPEFQTDTSQFVTDFILFSKPHELDSHKVKELIEGLAAIARDESKGLRRNDALNGPVPTFTAIEISAEIRAIPENTYQPSVDELRNLTVTRSPGLIDSVPLLSVRITDNFGEDTVFQTGEVGLRQLIVQLMRGLQYIETLKNIDINPGTIRESSKSL